MLFFWGGLQEDLLWFAPVHIYPAYTSYYILLAVIFAFFGTLLVSLILGQYIYAANIWFLALYFHFFASFFLGTAGRGWYICCSHCIGPLRS